MSEQGSKAGRKERHQAASKAQKERKKLRKQRAAIHGAMGEAEALRKRRKRGQGDFDKIMRELGYEALTGRGGVGATIVKGRDVTGDVTKKYEAIS